MRGRQRANSSPGQPASQTSGSSIIGCSADLPRRSQRPALGRGSSRGQGRGRPRPGPACRGSKAGGWAVDAAGAPGAPFLRAVPVTDRSREAAIRFEAQVRAFTLLGTCGSHDCAGKLGWSVMTLGVPLPAAATALRLPVDHGVGGMTAESSRPSGSIGPGLTPHAHVCQEGRPGGSACHGAHRSSSALKPDR